MYAVQQAGRYVMFLGLAVFLGCVQAPDSIAAQKILVVMSYDENYPWVQEIQEGIEKELPPGDWELKYAYLDTKKHFERGKERAGETYDLYQEFQPDAVIAVDDNAQSLFVVPYLKDNVKTPVVFCGVNSEPEEYGYPSTNITGVLERPFIDESIAFLETVLGHLETIAYIVKESPTGDLYFQDVQKISQESPVQSFAFKMPNTLPEALRMIAELKSQSDALFIMTVNGLLDESGQALDDKDIVPKLVEAFGKPTVTDLEAYLKYGVLCAVSQSGRTQGETAANMVKQILIEGSSPLEILITRNYWGKRILNVTALQGLGIKPQLKSLVGVELMKSAE